MKRTGKLENLMVSIGMLKCKADDVLEAGFPLVYRTKTEQEALTALYEEHARTATPHLDVYRLQRTDNAELVEADGGYLLFTKDGQRIVTPTVLVADLAKFGFILTVAEIFQRESDEKPEEEHIKLRLVWSWGDSTTEFKPNDDQKKIARRYFNRVYWKLFGFYDLDSVSLEGEKSPIRGSIVTLNFSGVMNAENEDKHRDEVRLVRMVDQDGHLACPLRPPPTPDEWRLGSPISAVPALKKAIGDTYRLPYTDEAPPRPRGGRWTPKSGRRG
jgi:hypothetical protein